MNAVRMPQTAHCPKAVARRSPVEILYAGIVLLLCAFHLPALAADSGVLGRWKTFSDKTGKPESIVRIVEVDGEIRGSIESIFPEPNEDPDPKCDKCPDEFKGKPVRGLAFMWGFRIEGSRLTSGKIIDPEEGSVYNCRIELADEGRTLKVRGYIGVPLFGRTQTWQRAEP